MGIFELVTETDVPPPSVYCIPHTTLAPFPPTGHCPPPKPRNALRRDNVADHRQAPLVRVAFGLKARLDELRRVGGRRRDAAADRSG